MNSTYWAPFAAHNTRTVQVKRSTPILCNLIRLILDLFHKIAQELLMGLMTSHSQKVDLNMAPGTKHCEHLFPPVFLFVSIYIFIDLLLADLGRDKMATIIQSGRDHGLPTYTQVHCHLAPAIVSATRRSSIQCLENILARHLARVQLEDYILDALGEGVLRVALDQLLL